jgi:hypothetical protein
MNFSHHHHTILCKGNLIDFNSILYSEFLMLVNNFFGFSNDPLSIVILRKVIYCFVL